MRIGFARLLKIILSSFFIQTSWSFFSMQGLGFLFNLISGAKKDQRNQIMKTHKEFFNTHPYMASYIIGATLRAYDEEKKSLDEIKKFITIAQTSFASAGDLLFWRTIRPTLLLLSVILALKAGIAGPLTFLIVYNIFHLYHRIQGIKDGYRLGADVIFILKSKRFTLTQKIFEICGAAFCGALISLISLQVNYLAVIPLTLLFILLLRKRVSSVFIILAVLLLLIIIVMV